MSASTENLRPFLEYLMKKKQEGISVSRLYLSQEFWTFMFNSVAEHATTTEVIHLIGDLFKEDVIEPIAISLLNIAKVIKSKAKNSLGETTANAFDVQILIPLAEMAKAKERKFQYMTNLLGESVNIFVRTGINPKVSYNREFSRYFGIPNDFRSLAEVFKSWDESIAEMNFTNLRIEVIPFDASGNFYFKKSKFGSSTVYDFPNIDLNGWPTDRPLDILEKILRACSFDSKEIFEFAKSHFVFNVIENCRGDYHPWGQHGYYELLNRTILISFYVDIDLIEKVWNFTQSVKTLWFKFSSWEVHQESKKNPYGMNMKEKVEGPSSFTRIHHSQNLIFPLSMISVGWNPLATGSLFVSSKISRSDYECRLRSGFLPVYWSRDEYPFYFECFSGKKEDNHSYVAQMTFDNEMLFFKDLEKNVKYLEVGSEEIIPGVFNLKNLEKDLDFEEDDQEVYIPNLEANPDGDDD